MEIQEKYQRKKGNHVYELLTWHSTRVPPDWTKSSTITTCRPAGSPSLIRTIRLSPSRTLAQTICQKKKKLCDASN